MIEIIRAKQLVQIAISYSHDVRPWQPTGLICVPIAGTREALDLDYLQQGETRGREKEVAHRKISGTLHSYMEARYRGADIPVVFDADYWSYDRYHREEYHTSMKGYTYSDTWGDAQGIPAWLRGRPNTEVKSISYEGYSYGEYTFTVQETHHSYDWDNRREFDWSPTVSQYTVGFSETPEVVFSKDPSRAEILSYIPESWNPEDYKPNMDVWSALYAEALNGVFPLDTNNIANAIEIKDTVETLIKLTKTVTSKGKNLGKYFIKESVEKALKADAMPILRKHVNPKAAAKCWLAYRYQYMTTKLDIEEHRAHLASAWDTFCTWGEHSIVRHATASDGKTVYNLKIEVLPKVSTGLQGLWVKLRALGLQPNLVNGWDLVPLSFVVDWMLPVENLLQAVDESCTFTKTNFSFYDKPLVSTKTISEISSPWGVLTDSYYVRYMLPNFPVFLPAEDVDPQTKTSIYRLADGVSLIVGMH